MTTLERKCWALVRKWRTEHWILNQFACAQGLESALKPRKRVKKGKAK